MSHLISSNGNSKRMSYKYTRRDSPPAVAIFPVPEEILRARRLEAILPATEPKMSYNKRTRIIQLALAGVAILAVAVGLTAHLVRRRSAPGPKLLIVSFDGLRWDYPDIYRPDMPFFNQFAQDGVRANRGIEPCFSTETFPNHFSIATGLFEESHGIISNSMYDPVLNRSFSINDPTWFQNGDPIWTTARRQNLTTGTYFWVGSAHQIQGLRPNFYEVYNSSVNYDVRIDTVLSWFTDNNLNLGMLYFERPDIDGHFYGVHSDQFKSAIKDVDSTLGYLLYRVDERRLKNDLNIIVLGDHGMVNIQQRIVLEDYLNLTDIWDYEGHSRAVVNIFPMPDQEDHIFSALENAHPNLTVYRKGNIPDRLHYKYNRRIAPIVAVADKGFVIVKSNSTSSPHIGYHGYDNRVVEMQAFFAAQGPAFKRQFQVETFKNVDVYPLACRILGIRPSPNNGTFDNVKNLLFGQ